MRAAIRKALPQAAEVISYQMPAFKLGGNYSCILRDGRGTFHFTQHFPH